MTRFGPVIVGAVLACLIAAPGLAMSGADALKQLNHDADQTIELPEVFNRAVQRFNDLNKDNDLTLEKAEVQGLVTDAEWKQHNRDHDGALELDEWLKIVRARFTAADTDGDGRLTAKELESPAGQSLLKLVIQQ